MGWAGGTEAPCPGPGCGVGACSPHLQPHTLPASTLCPLLRSPLNTPPSPHLHAVPASPCHPLPHQLLLSSCNSQISLLAAHQNHQGDSDSIGWSRAWASGFFKPRLGILLYQLEELLLFIRPQLRSQLSWDAFSNHPSTRRPGLDTPPLSSRVP